VTSKPLFSNLTLWILAVVLAFPSQVLVLVIAQLGNDLKDVSPSVQIGAYACTNYIHGSTPFRCNLGRLVSNAAEGAVLLDVFTVGLAFILAVLAVALVLMGVRILHLRLWLRPDTSLERTRAR
jgi:hypothetical protein